MVHNYKITAVQNLTLLLGFVLLTSAFAGDPKNIFVSPLGKVGNSGLKIDVPLKSIQAALVLSSPGDTIYLLPGTYHEAIKIDNKNGIAEKAIFIYGYSLDEPAIIDGGVEKPSAEASGKCMRMNNSSWIEIGNLTFRNGWIYPIKLVDASYISFTHCQFQGGRIVITATGWLTHHILVDNCFWDQGGEYVWNLEKDLHGTDAWTSMHHGELAYYNGSLVDIRGTGGSLVIRNNTIVNAFNGIQLKAKKGFDTNVEIYNNSISNIRDNDIEPEHYAYNLYIHHNRFHNIHKTMSIDNVAGGYIYYYGNQITSDTSTWAKQICTGFWKIYGGNDSLTYPVYAFNNSFCGVGRAFSSTKEKTILFKHFNNAYVFLCGRSWEVPNVDASSEFDYDISNKACPSVMVAKGYETHGQIKDVMYVDRYNFDLRLQASSPAIDAGKIIQLSELNWSQSFAGNAPDVGAYEGEKLIDGPAFQFQEPPLEKVSYKEKPRIVKYSIEGSRLKLYFSTAIDPATLSPSYATLTVNGKNEIIKYMTCSNSKFEVIIETVNDLTNAILTLDFHTLPKGMNEEDITYWASVIKRH